MELYDRIIDPDLTIRRVTIAANRLVDEREAAEADSQGYEQLDLFTDYGAQEQEREAEKKRLEKERKLQEAMLHESTGGRNHHREKLELFFII